VLPGRVRKSGKVVGYDRVGRSLIGKRSSKLFGQELVNPILATPLGINVQVLIIAPSFAK
jgi:hypothetical protein